MRIGIIFGGKSREREISFAGGRTVYDLLDKSVFTPVPVFVDSLGNFILLDWQFLYKGSIRDFYPNLGTFQKFKTFGKFEEQNFQTYIECLNLTKEEQDAMIASVGKRVLPNEFKEHFDFAFLALHGPYGEDGSVQGILDFYDMPYSGSGILPSAIGINKKTQKHLSGKMNILCAASENIEREEWLHGNQSEIFERIKTKANLPCVIKSATQGSSIGVSILGEWDFETFKSKVNQSLFIREVKKEEWMGLSQEEKKLFTQQLCDVYEGTGIPFKVADKIYHHPAEIFALLQEKFAANKNAITFESLQTETSVLVEEFIKGKEFSCIVVEGENGEPIALPPTEIIKTEMIFNYRAKYLPGISRKVTPINIEEEKIIKITKACESLYTDFGFDVYARIDGIIREDGKIFLNDPNTTSGMLPSSFFFHQAAEIGLSPGQFLTYIIWRSLVKRRAQSHRAYSVDVVLKNLEEAMANKFTSTKAKPTVAVVLGGNSSERHISVESGRNVYEKLSSSGHYNTLPVFLDYTNNVMRFFILPLNLLLKDNADDIREKSKNYLAAPIIKKIIEKAGFITQKFASKNYEFKPKEISLDELCTMADSVFIALHGRPGEDGTLQTELEKYGKPYNGSGPYSSNNTINKFITNEMFKEAGLLIPKHLLINKEDWEKTHEEVLGTIADKIGFPIIAKPADDGCSSAVKKIDTPQELVDYAHGVFRNQEAINIALRELLSLKENEEFPMKNFFVVEELVKPNGAEYFLEITGGMLAKTLESGEIIYEVFEPSEALASKGILSLEEKFLAGEGQNITPARFSKNPEYNKKISSAVKEKLEQAARILQVEGYCRIDAFVRIYSEEKVEVIFIEINSLPGLTPATCIFHQAAINGYKPFEFLDKIIDYGKEKATLATAK